MRSIIVLALFLAAACSDDHNPDGGPADAHAPGSDAGPPDASAPHDGGGADDAGSPDAGVDAGVDAGSICGDALCALDEDATSCCADCGVCTEGAVVRMETGVPTGAPGTGLTPGGMADTHAAFARATATEMIYPFTVIDEPVAGSQYFWAQQFFFEGTTQGGYTGLQSDGIIAGHRIGKMAIFSIWDALEATPGPGAQCQTFGGEGVGYSCRLPFEWRENVTYRMILREVAADSWSLAMFDPSIGAERLIGTIRAPAPWGRVRLGSAGFAEYYGQVASCATLPHAVALLHQPTADGEAPTSVEAATYGTCMARASSVCTGPLCR